MKCCLLGLLLLSCIDNREQIPVESPKKTEFLKPTNPDQRYKYKGQFLTFQEWRMVIREHKSGYHYLPKKAVTASTPSDDMWLTPPSQISEQKPLLRRTRNYNSLNQFGEF